MPRESKKDKILDAAEKILQDESYDFLSLDHIAKISGVSKGGLLYHFPTKEAVLTSLVTRLIQKFDDEFDKELRGGNSDFRDVFLSINMNPKMLSAARGLMAAVSFNQDLIKPLRDAYTRWDKIIFSQFANKNEAWRFRIFFDGLFFCSLLDLPLPSKKDLKEVVHEFKLKG